MEIDGEIPYRDNPDSGIEDLVVRLVRPVLEEMGLELFDLQFRRERPGWVLRIIIDAEHGISLDDCAAVSREVGDLLDIEDVIDRPYHLEVSSPGIDRPLRNEGEFRRFIGHRAKITATADSGKRYVVRGEIRAVENGRVTLDTGAGAPLVLSFDRLVKANLEVEF